MEWMNSGLDGVGLAERVAGLAGRINAATCDLLGLIAEADQRHLWEGFSSCANWLTFHCGFGRGAAAEHVRVARVLVHRPLMREAFAEGSLSYSQVRALTRAPADVEEQVLVDLAKDATGAQLERLVRGMRRVSAAEEDEGAARQYVDWRVGDDGMLVLHARLSGEQAAVVMAALEQAHMSASSQLDALVDVARAAGRGWEGPEGDRGTVMLVADLETVEEAVGLLESSAEDSSTRWEPTGVCASAVTLATMLCDQQVTLAASLRDGSLVDLGRSRRRPSAVIQRAVLRRHDHACAVPRCGSRRHLHLHHVQHWARGGRTSVDNLVPLCGQHHRALHAAGPDADISSLSRARPTPAGPIRGLAQEPAYDRADVAGRAIRLSHRRGERLQYSWAVAVLMQRGARRAA